MPAYHFQRIEPKWQAYWERNRTFRARDLVAGKPKFYVLDMFPYPSGAGLHVGHPEGYTATDISAATSGCAASTCCTRWAGTPSACPPSSTPSRPTSTPAITTQKNIDNFRRQLKSLGFSYDWDREVDTTDPDYYSWTQWIFLQIYRHLVRPRFRVDRPQGQHPQGQGPPDRRAADPARHRPTRDAYRDAKRLAYRAEVPVNWCPALGTVLANEEVIDGKCERGGHPVVRMPLRQWMLRITAYAERLLDDLDTLDWPEAIKDMQRNWIGRSEGAEVDFPSRSTSTTGRRGRRGRGSRRPRPTSSASSPPAPTRSSARPTWCSPPSIRSSIASPPPSSAKPSRPTARPAARKSDLDRTDLAKDKTGVFTGAYAINPVNGQQIPIWIADYVLMGYGTGAIMAVPGHDERDFEFATQFDLPIVARRLPDELVRGTPETSTPTGDAAELRRPGRRRSTRERRDHPRRPADRRGQGRASPAGSTSDGLGRKTVNYKLRDWLFSRQRYWGEPFPILLDEHDRAHAVPEAELPVASPSWTTSSPPASPSRRWARPPTGSSYLRRPTAARPTPCPSGPAPAGTTSATSTRRTPTRFFDPEKERYWMPVDLYVGGAEHAVLHLLYGRFWHKVLFDRGLRQHARAVPAAWSTRG